MAGTAHSIYGAIKTGKAIAAAAKGAAVGGPYGAVAGLPLAAGQNGKKLLAAVLALLMLPMLVVLMLPGLIFGDLTSSGALALNDEAAISSQMSAVVSAIDTVLLEGIADAETRIAQDFATTSGDNYEIVNPYATDRTGSVKSFIAQYCAAKVEVWDTISLTDLQDILRQGKGSLYSYTRTSETRTVEADDPNTPNVVETNQETWYIYTLAYNGEGYFADTVFHLTDTQKSLANNYAENLSVFLGDGSSQYTKYSGGTVDALGDVRFTDGSTEVVYFNQLDQRWANKPFGTDNIGGYGCGPTSMAIVVSSLTDEIVDPAKMAKWAYEHGGWCKGHFTTSGHFIVLRGVQDGKILVADPASTSKSQKAWDLSIILNEAGHRAGAGGPFWIIG